MRRIFQIDGLDKGILNIGEQNESDQVVICVSRDNQETQILLDKEAFEELTDLRYKIRFQSDKDSERNLKAVL